MSAVNFKQTRFVPTLIFVALLLSATTSFAQETAVKPSVPQAFTDAMKTVTNSDDFQFAYTVTVKTDEGPVIGKYDPRQPDEGWSLVTPAQASALNETQSKAWAKMTKRKNPGTAIQVKDISGPLTFVSTVSVSPNLATYTVKPMGLSSFSGSHEKVVSELASKVTVQLDPPRLISMTSVADKSFSVAPFAEIHSVTETAKMQYLAEHDVTVIKSIDLNVTGNHLVMSHSPDENFEISNVVAIPKP